MSEAALPGQTSRTGVGDAAVVRARQAEDVLVGGEIVRHRLSSRAIHWTVALFFFVCLFTGLPIWTPLFGWMATLFGGLSVCRWLHPWTGVAFSIATLVMFVMWFPEPFGNGVRQLSYVVHDIAFILFVAMIIGHIYLGTAAEPGTFSAIVRGTVTKEWARLHHPKWYRQVTGDAKKR